jgi:hypothetical protein
MRVGFIVVAFSVLGMCPPAACQQATTGTVVGCVTDASGGTLPGVDVTASGSGITAHAVTNATGCYVLAQVPVGTYVAEAKLLGFRTERHSASASSPENRRSPLAGLEQPDELYLFCTCSRVFDRIWRL